MAQMAAREFSNKNRFNDHIEPVFDAEFETVGETYQLHKEQRHIEVDDRKKQTILHKSGMSVFGRKPVRPLPDDSIAFYGFGAILVVLSFWVSGGHSLFGNVDKMTTASIQMASSEIADASWRVVTNDGKSALHIEGIVRNSGKEAMHTKPVIITVKLKNGSTKRYSLGQKGWTLGAGQEVVVSGRLDIGSASIASVVIALSN